MTFTEVIPESEVDSYFVFNTVVLDKAAGGKMDVECRQDPPAHDVGVQALMALRKAQAVEFVFCAQFEVTRLIPGRGGHYGNLIAIIKRTGIKIEAGAKGLADRHAVKSVDAIKCVLICRNLDSIQKAKGPGDPFKMSAQHKVGIRS